MKVCVFTESFSEKSLQSNKHQVKSVDIRSFSGPFFHVLGLNMEIYFVNLRIYSVNLCIQSKRRKIWTRKTPSMYMFYMVFVSLLWKNFQ